MAGILSLVQSDGVCAKNFLSKMNTPIMDLPVPKVGLFFFNSNANGQNWFLANVIYFVWYFQCQNFLFFFIFI